MTMRARRPSRLGLGRMTVVMLSAGRATRCEVTRRDDANAAMLTQDEKVTIASHYGRCFPCDGGREDWRVYHLGQQLDLRTYRSRERRVVGEESY